MPSPLVPGVDLRHRPVKNPQLGDFVIYPRLGNPNDDPRPPRGPGLIFSGGHGHVADAYAGMQRVITGGAPRGGDIVVIRATPDDTYSAQIMAAAPFDSVQTICVPQDATPGQLAAAAIVARAEGVFFSGGQQSRYVAWKGSPLIDAVQRVHDRGGVVGGTSAGLAILGQTIFDGKRARSSQVTTDALLADPDNPAATFTRDLFDFAPMHGVITDTHFGARDRFGRLVTFMARQKTPIGVGVDEQTALCVDGRGVGHLERMVPGKGNAYIIESRAAEVHRDAPLGPVKNRVTRIDSAGDRFGFRHRRGNTSAGTYEVVVNGRGGNKYSVDPYTYQPPA